MDTNPEQVVASRSARRGKYRHHPIEFKRAVVEQTLQPGTSVSRVAREHDLNANQVFTWRRAYRNGTLGGESSPTLLPIEVTASSAPTPLLDDASSPADVTSVLIIESSRGRLRIEGQPDASTLRLVLDRLLAG